VGIVGDSAETDRSYTSYNRTTYTKYISYKTYMTYVRSRWCAVGGLRSPRSSLWVFRGRFSIAGLVPLLSVGWVLGTLAKDWSRIADCRRQKVLGPLAME